MLKMDIAPLKEALGDEMFTELETYVGDLTGQRDQARNESISGRKGLKEKIANLESAQTSLLERLGVDSVDDIDELPDVAGMAEAGKQYEAKLKRLDRQLAEAKAAKDAVEGKYKDSRRDGIVSQALSEHNFLAKDMVAGFINSSLVWEGDDLLYKADDGNLISVKDGVAGIAKSRPELLQPTSAGGAGVRSTNARGTSDAATMTRADFEALPPEKRMEMSNDGIVLQ